MSKSTKQITPAIDLLVPSIEIIKNNIFTYFVLAVLPMLVITYGSKDISNDLNLIFNQWLALGSFLGILFMAPLAYTLTLTSKGEEVSLDQSITNGYKYFFRLIGLNIIIGFAVIIGLILFIIPGIIMIRRYYLSSYFLIDQNLSIKEAMNKSANISKQNSSAIYGIIGVLLLFSFFGILPGIGAIISSILQFLYSVAPGLRYHEMKKAYRVK